MRVKWVFRRDTTQGFYRVLRVLWSRGNPGDGVGYSAKLSVALHPRLWSAPKRDTRMDWRVTFLGVRLHYCRSYGGLFV